MINPINNIIDNIYRATNNVQQNIILHIKDSLFGSILRQAASSNAIVAKNYNETIGILNLFNINGYITDNYIEYSQYRNHMIYSHIKDIVILTDFPMEFLKREDFILLSERMSQSRLVCFDSNIAEQWSDVMSGRFDIIQPAVIDKQINIDSRKNLVVLSDNSKLAQKICSILYRYYQDMKIITKFDNYEQTFDELNNYKVCLNLNATLDSLPPLAAGCLTIGQKKLNEFVIPYNSIDDMQNIINQLIKSFDVKKQKDISSQIIERYRFDIFAKKTNKLINTHFKEAFVL